MPAYKQRCMICKKNMVLIKSYRTKPICEACQMKDINAPVTDPKYKKLFDIDVELYKKSDFLRRIKSYYLRFETLSERQIEVFQKVVKDLTEKALENP